MDIEASWLLEQVQADMKATSERQHRDARRQHALRAASLALGTGRSAREVHDQLARTGLSLKATKQREARLDDCAKEFIDWAAKVASTRPGYDGYQR